MRGPLTGGTYKSLCYQYYNTRQTDRKSVTLWLSGHMVFTVQLVCYCLLFVVIVIIVIIIQFRV